MKKFLVVAAAAALALTSCSTSFSANDTLDTPNLKAVATENGVIVVTWDAVKDAGSYSLLVKNPGTEEFNVAKSAWYNDREVTSFATYAGRNVFTWNYDNPEEEYEFKLVTTSNKSNLLASETTVSVTTPAKEDIKDTEFDASKLTVSLVPNTKNNYELYMPVNAGYNYTFKFVTSNAIDAKSAWYDGASTITQNNMWNYDGASYINKTIKVTNAEGDEEDALAPAKLGNYVAANSKVQYVVVKATPKNARLNTVKYAIATATIPAYDYSEDAVEVSSLRAVKTSASNARVTFTAADKENYVDADPSMFTIYRVATVRVDDNNQTMAEAMTKVGTPKLAEAGKGSAYAKFYFDDAITADTKVKGGVTSYTYYVAVNNGSWYTNSAAVLNNTLTYANESTAEGYATVKLASPTISLSQPTVNDPTLKVTINATTDATTVVKYAVFTTKAAMLNAVEADFVNTLSVDKVSSTTNSRTDETIDGANNVDKTTITTSSGTLKLATGVKTTIKASGEVTTTNAGSYYLFVVVSTKAGEERRSEVKWAYVEETEPASGTISKVIYNN